MWVRGRVGTEEAPRSSNILKYLLSGCLEAGARWPPNPWTARRSSLAVVRLNLVPGRLTVTTLEATLRLGFNPGGGPAWEDAPPSVHANPG